ncbi:F-box protein At5g07610-like [Papaver somniferum]|uniref:F-box protein At5g07610-like n=1 Tax=Papaver somniferum TaxID=3469 RepID=UPI000E704049|nr:F-box protein At5g07610-like [Papaver somniferum]
MRYGHPCAHSNVLASTHGLVLCCRRKHDCCDQYPDGVSKYYICNPLTKEIRRLSMLPPEFPETTHFGSWPYGSVYGSAKSAVSSESAKSVVSWRVFRILSCSDSETFHVQVYSSDTRSWNTYDVSCSEEFHGWRWIRNIVSKEGNLYWLGKENQIICHPLNTSKCSLIGLPDMAEDDEEEDDDDDDDDGVHLNMGWLIDASDDKVYFECIGMVNGYISYCRMDEVHLNIWNYNGKSWVKIHTADYEDMESSIQWLPRSKRELLSGSGGHTSVGYQYMEPFCFVEADNILILKKGTDMLAYNITDGSLRQLTSTRDDFDTLIEPWETAIW